MPIGSPNSAQKLTNFPAMTAARPGNIQVQNSGPVFVAVPAGGGTVTLNGATPVPVVDARVTANSIIVFTVITPAGTISPNAPNVLTKTPGTGFTVGGTALDTGLYAYAIFG